MGLNYSELISNNNENKILKTTLYREKTNVFTYYILKMILLYDYDNFLSWCYENNNLLLKFRKTPKNVLSFYNFVLSTYKTKMLVKKLRHFYQSIFLADLLLMRTCWISVK